MWAAPSESLYSPVYVCLFYIICFIDLFGICFNEFTACQFIPGVSLDGFSVNDDGFPLLDVVIVAILLGNDKDGTKASLDFDTIAPCDSKAFFTYAT